MNHSTDLRALAAYGLTGTTALLPDGPLDAGRFQRLLGDVVTERLTGRMVMAAREGALQLNTSQAGQLSERHFAAVCSWLHLESTLLQVAQVFDTAGVDFQVLKGPAAAHLIYHDASLRGFGDIDLLVRSDQIDDATRALTAAGYRRPVSEPRRGFDRRFGKGATFQAQNGDEVDLHRTLVMGAYGLLIDLDELWAETDTFEVGGRVVTAPDADRRLLLACYNAALGDKTPRLGTLRDIAELLISDAVDHDQVRALARRWQAEAVLARGISLAWSTLEISDALRLSEWARRYRPNPEQARMLATYTSDSSYAAKAWMALTTLPRQRDRAAFAMSLAFPAGGELGGRRRSLVSRMRSAVSGFRGPETSP